MTSFPRKREPRRAALVRCPWDPACARVTTAHDPGTRPLRPGPRGGDRRRAGGAAAVRRPRARCPADADRAGARDRPVHRAGDGLWLPGLERRGGRLLGRQRGGELQQPEASDLQDHRHLGEPRGFHAALGVDPHVFRRACRAVRQQSAGFLAGNRPVGTGLDRRGVPALHSGDLQSVRATVAGADLVLRRCGPA